MEKIKYKTGDEIKSNEIATVYLNKLNEIVDWINELETVYKGISGRWRINPFKEPKENSQNFKQGHKIIDAEKLQKFIYKTMRDQICDFDGNYLAYKIAEHEIEILK